MTAPEVYANYYPDLVTNLPMKDVSFTALLFKKGLFPGNVKAQVKSEQTAQDGAEYFLDNMIGPPISSSNDTGPFEKLLSAMEEFTNDFLKKLACTIREHLKGGASGGGGGTGAGAGGSTGLFDCNTARTNLQKEFASLVSLPILSLLPSLLANGVVTMDEKKKIERKEQNDLDGMNYFLTEVIDRSLLNKVKDKYKGFLLTMEQHDDSLLRTIAERLGGSRSVL